MDDINTPGTSILNPGDDASRALDSEAEAGNPLDSVTGHLGNAAANSYVRNASDQDSAERRQAAVGAARTAVKAAKGDYVGAAIEGAQTVPVLVKAIIIPILVIFLVIGYALNPRQIFYQAQAFWQGLEADIGEEYLANTTGVKAWDLSPLGIATEGGGAVLHVLGDRLTEILFSNKEEDVTEGGYDQSTDGSYLGEITYTDDASQLDVAMDRRMQAVQRRVDARAKQLQRATKISDMATWLMAVLGVNIDQNQLIGEWSHSLSEDSFATLTNQTFRTYAAAELLAAYTIQQNGTMQADTMKGTGEVDADGNLTDVESKADSLAKFLEWVGYQDEDWFSYHILRHYDYPWKGTFLPQPLFEAMQEQQDKIYLLDQKIEAAKGRLAAATESEDKTTQSSVESEIKKLNEQKSAAQEKIDQYNKYSTAMLNYIITVSAPTVTASYMHYDSNGNRTDPLDTDENGNPIPGDTTKTVVVLTCQSSVQYATADEIAKIMGFWSGDSEANATGAMDFTYNRTLAAQDEQVIATATGEEKTEDPDKGTVTSSTDVAADKQIEEEVQVQASELENLDSNAVTDTDAEIEPKEAKNHFDVNGFFDKKKTYYNTSFGYSADQVGTMKGALMWGRDEDGNLVYKRADFDELKVYDADVESGALTLEEGETSGYREVGNGTGGGSQNYSGTNDGSSAILNYAEQFVGNPYVWGGNSLTNGIDCSGFVHQVLGHFNISSPRQSASFRSWGEKVDVEDMQVGDIVCYSGHVGFYAGNGKLLSALNSKRGITYCSVNYKPILAVRRPKQSVNVNSNNPNKYDPELFGVLY